MGMSLHELAKVSDFVQTQDAFGNDQEHPGLKVKQKQFVRLQPFFKTSQEVLLSPLNSVLIISLVPRTEAILHGRRRATTNT